MASVIMLLSVSPFLSVNYHIFIFFSRTLDQNFNQTKVKDYLWMKKTYYFFTKKKKERKFLSQKGDYNFWIFFSCNQQTCVRTVLKLRNICQTSDVAHGHFVLISHLTSSMCSWSVQFWLISILLPCILFKIELLTCIKRHEFLLLCIRLCIIIFFGK